jgi:uncharacterized protein YndB with AHSA1/START domain
MPDTPNVEINAQAPVVGKSDIEIDALPESVWGVLTDFDRWPSWNDDVKSMEFSGPLEVGTQFRWKAGPGTIVSTITEAEPPHRLAWTGKTLGISAIHVWVLEGRSDRTFVRTEESYDGLVARLLRGTLQRTLDTALERGLRSLKAEVEGKPV